MDAGFLKESNTRVYILVVHKGEERLNCRYNGEWVTDSTCTRINELLAEGIVSPETVSDWLTLHKTETAH